MKKIIVADDEELIRNLVSDFLVKEGYEPLKASDGEEALALFDENPDVALLILDIMMPNMDDAEHGWLGGMPQIARKKQRSRYYAYRKKPGVR